MIFAWAAQRLHESFHPGGPHVNDDLKFFSRWHMDDAVILEAAVGLRPWLSGDCLDGCMRKIWGPDAINEDKKDEEGTFAPKQLVWVFRWTLISRSPPSPNRRASKLSTCWPYLS